VVAQLLAANGDKLFYHIFMNESSRHNYEILYKRENRREKSMTLAGFIVMGVGVFIAGIGLIFMIPYKNVRRFADNKVQGTVVDMVWNAAAYNTPLEEAAEVEHFKILGMEFKPGTRQHVGQMNEAYVHLGDGQPDTNKVMIGQGPVNMYHKVYRYIVDGKEYTRADGVRYNKGVVQSWIGKTVMVYYNPENPQQSTLSNGGGYKLTMIILYMVGGFLVLLGMILLLFGGL
jgi:hypothetical protein